MARSMPCKISRVRRHILWTQTRLVPFQSVDTPAYLMNRRSIFGIRTNSPHPRTECPHSFCLRGQNPLPQIYLANRPESPRSASIIEQCLIYLFIYLFFFFIFFFFCCCFFCLIQFYVPFKLFHSYRDESIGRWGENRSTRRKTT